MVVVISEESGLISLAEGGTLERGLSATELRERLEVGTETVPVVDLTTSGVLPTVEAVEARTVVSASTDAPH